VTQPAARQVDFKIKEKPVILPNLLDTGGVHSVTRSDDIFNFARDMPAAPAPRRPRRKAAEAHASVGGTWVL